MIQKKVTKKHTPKKMPHCDETSSHSQHLCVLSARLQIGKVAQLAKGAQYVCHVCGRAAKKASNLCAPMKI